ncbi:hypothetical protein GCM10007385_42820 [Tateyamaria omphalii]|uniref:hypothetical protein n=1 Tax=Tateyamaria omphalii TaxID=299262 RepID=UPI00199F7732|nr:hypothetical protein [Tateyamaria omphalii]GGX69013.1 hypothetical protein GCM10007385_42820 [Tateyamaria omphalii]
MAEPERNLKHIILGLVVFFANPAIAANWHSYGTCSYHIAPDGQNFSLISKANCRQDFYGGTGHFVAKYNWQNGNEVIHVDTYDDQSEKILETLNDVNVIASGVGLKSNDGLADYGYCTITSASRGLEATCFKRLSDQIPGH